MKNILVKAQEGYGWRRYIMNSSSNSRVITFRIDKDVISTVEQESKRRGINLNNMANQILKSYVDWDMLQARAGMIPIAKPLLVELLNKISNEEIVSIASNVGRNTIKEIVSFMRNKMDLDSFLTWLELWLKKNSTSGYNHSTDETTNVHTYIIKHDLGEKWSLYHKTVLEVIFKEVLQKPLINLTSSNMLITFSFQR
jgi:hypothetical protein